MLHKPNGQMSLRRDWFDKTKSRNHGGCDSSCDLLVGAQTEEEDEVTSVC